MYTVVEEVPEDTERVLEAAESKAWGDVRGLLGCEYLVDVVPSREGGGVVVAGSHTDHWVDLVPLRKTAAGIEGWNMVREEGVRLHEGHGGEVVRGVWVDEGVSERCSPCPTLLSYLLTYLLTTRSPTTANTTHGRRVQSIRRARTDWSGSGGHRRRWGMRRWAVQRSGRSARRRSAESARRRRRQRHGTGRISWLCV